MLRLDHTWGLSPQTTASTKERNSVKVFWMVYKKPPNSGYAHCEGLPAFEDLALADRPSFCEYYKQSQMGWLF